jgi:hypothetical protein
MNWLDLVARFFGGALRTTASVTALGLGGLLISLFLAQRFGRFHGGNDIRPS